MKIFATILIAMMFLILCVMEKESKKRALQKRISHEAILKKSA